MSTTRAKPRSQSAETYSTTNSYKRNTKSVRSHQKQQKSMLVDETEKPFDIEAPRLSIADRFMSSNYTSRATSPTLHPLAKSIDSDTPTSTNYSTQPLALDNTTSPVARKLSIADTFMRSSSISSPTTITSRSRAASFADELDMGVIDSNSRSASRKPSHVHPLEASSFFEESIISTPNFNLISPTSSILINNNDRKTSRPWGSQDTLVHLQPERKKSLYAQFTGQENRATSPFSLDDYYVNTITSTAKTIKQREEQVDKYSTYEDIEINNEEPNYSRDYSDDDEEKNIHMNEDRVHDVKSSDKQNAKRKRHQKKQDSQVLVDEPSKGFWIACCFISCGKRPKHTTASNPHKNSNKKPKKRLGCGRRGWVFCVFTSLIVFVLAIYFLWPRTPLMRIEGASLTSPAKLTETKHGALLSNVVFESEWLVNITVDNRQNHVPTQLTRVQIIAKDALTGLIIGKGVHNEDYEGYTLAPSSISTIQVPIRVDYQARDSTDTTFVDLTRACTPGHPLSYTPPELAKREALPLHFWITLHFFGLDWLGYKPTVIATPATGGFACPLPS